MKGNFYGIFLGQGFFIAYINTILIHIKCIAKLVRPEDKKFDDYIFVVYTVCFVILRSSYPYIYYNFMSMHPESDWIIKGSRLMVYFSSVYLMVRKVRIISKFEMFKGWMKKWDTEIKG